MGLKIVVNRAQLANLERRLTLAAKGSDRELQNAMASTRRGTLTEATRAIARRYNLAQKRIRDDLFAFGTDSRVGPRLGRAEGFDLSKGKGRGFVILGRRQPISFRSYGARQTRKGVSFAIRRGQRKLITDAFAGRGPGATSQSKRDIQRRQRYAEQINRAYGRTVADPNLLFWERTGQPKRVMTKGYNEGLKKEPIKPLFGPSIADHLLQRDVRADIDRYFITKLGTEYRRRLARLLRR